MRSDDRMMAILTVMILIIAIATVVQKSDVARLLFGPGPSIVLQNDRFKVEPGRFVALDVLANDKGISPSDRASFLIIREPECGLVRRERGYIELDQTTACTGVVTIGYCVARDDDCVAAQAEITFLGDPTITATTKGPDAPAIPDAPVSNPMATEIVRLPADRAVELAAAAQLPMDKAAAPSITPPKPVETESASTPSVQSPLGIASPVARSETTNEVFGTTDRATTDSLHRNSPRRIAQPQRMARPESPSLPRALPEPMTRPRTVAIIEPSRPQVQSAAPVARDMVADTDSGTPPVARPQIAALPEKGPDATRLLTAPERPAPPISNQRSTVKVNPPPDPPPGVRQIAPNTPPRSPSLTPRVAPVQTAPAVLAAPGRPSSGPNVPSNAPKVVVAPKIEENGTQVPDTVVARAAPINPRAVLSLRPNEDSRPNLPVDPGGRRIVSVMRVGAPDAPANAEREILVLPARIAPETSSHAASTLSAEDRREDPAIVDRSVPPQPRQAPEISVAVLQPRPETAEPVVEAAVPSPILPEPSVPEPSVTVPVETELPQQPDAEVAALPDTNSEIVDTPSRVLATCGADLFVRVVSGQNVELALHSPCRPDQPVTIFHEGLEFTVLTDASGSAKQLAPAFAEDARFEARFADGATAVAETRVTGMDRVSRAALVWGGSVDLDLHAFEYGAREGQDGHVWQGTPRSYTQTRREGGGYLLRLGDPKAGGMRSEVYTIHAGRNNPRGVVKLSVGVTDVREACGQDIRYATVRATKRRASQVRDVSLVLSDCEQGVGQRLYTSGFRDLAVAGR